MHIVFRVTDWQNFANLYTSSPDNSEVFKNLVEVSIQQLPGPYHKLIGLIDVYSAVLNGWGEAGLQVVKTALGLL